MITRVIIAVAIVYTLYVWLTLAEVDQCERRESWEQCQ